jgi:small conductance mechanosensitive channel
MEQNANELIAKVVELTSTWGLKVVGAIVVLIVGRIICGMIRRGVRHSLERSQIDESLIPFLSSTVYYLALAAVIIAVLNLFGVQTTSVVAVLGAASLAVGLALQGTLSNFSAGTMLLIFRPFRIGHWVEVAGAAGSVKEIGLFSTVLHTGDNVRITIPNSAIYGNTIKNYSANDTRRIDLVMGISYDDDIARAIETIEKTLAGDSRVLQDPAPQIAVSELGDSSVNLVVRPWVAASEYWPTRFDLTRRLKENLEGAGCSIPYPQRDVHIHGNGAAAGA